MSTAQTPIRRALLGTGVLRVGHRGAAALAKENTLDAFAVALEHGVDMVELDVVRGPAGDLVVAHEPAAIQPDSPSLEAALSFLGREAPAETTLNVDLKLGDAAGELVELLDRHSLAGRAIVSALHGRWLRELRRHCPELATGISYPSDRAGAADRAVLKPLVGPATAILRRALPLRVLGMAASARADAVMLHHSVVSPRAVERCRSRGLPVFAWTVDELDLAWRMREAGVRGIITNDPGVLEAV